MASSLSTLPLLQRRSEAKLRCVLALAAVLIGLSRAAPAQLPPDLAGERGTHSGPLGVKPGYLELPGGRVLQDRQPIARALELAAPGALILVGAGTYPRLGIGFSGNNWWSANTTGGSEGNPIRVVGESGARLVCDEPGDTIAINQQVPCAFIDFENLEIEAGERAGILFYQLPNDQRHRGFRFYDCSIDGAWDHASNSGPHSSKWAVLGHNLDGFVFAGRRGRAVVQRIRHEHGFYLQNPFGDLTLENIDAKELGRTFVQVTARESSGPPGVGLITVRGCQVSDVGLAAGDGFKGGSAFTFAGRLKDNVIRVENCTYRAGFDPFLAKLTQAGEPYGTGALVAWDGGEKLANGTLILSGNHFEFAPGCGDRPVVSIGACQVVEITGNNRFIAGGQYPVLSLDPLTVTGSLKNLPNGQVRVDPSNSFTGRLEIRGRPVEADQLPTGTQTPEAKSLAPAETR
jgi:hypothetical protein